MPGRQQIKRAQREATSRPRRDSIKRVDGRNAQVSEVRAAATDAQATADEALAAASNFVHIGGGFLAATGNAGNSATYSFAGGRPILVSVQVTFDNTFYYQITSGMFSITTYFTTSAVTVTNGNASGCSVLVHIVPGS